MSEEAHGISRRAFMLGSIGALGPSLLGGNLGRAEKPQLEEFDVCIVGSGFAGIFLAQELVPAWLNSEKSKDRRNFRIWCAGCSTGEEPYTIAMTVMEALAGQRAVKLRILATDLDSKVLQTAARGVYDSQRIEDIEKFRLKQWFMMGTGTNQGKVKVMPMLQAAIRFKQHNINSQGGETMSFVQTTISIAALRGNQE